MSVASEEEKKFVIEHVFNDVSNMKPDTSVNGPLAKYGGVYWYIRIHREQNFAFLFHLDCFPFDVSDDWKIETTLNGTASYSNTKHVFDSQNTFSKPSSYIPSSLIGNKTLTVRLDVKIDEITGIKKAKLRSFDDDSAKELSDVVLIAGDQKFHISKMYLSLHSSYFKTLFSGKFSESGKSEIELKEVDAEHLQTFLEVVYGEPAIDRDCYLEVLKLADFFDSKTVIRRCEKYILNKPVGSLKTNFELAVKHKMEKLKSKCIFEMKTGAEFRSIVPKDVNDIDNKTWMQLLMKATDYF